MDFTSSSHVDSRDQIGHSHHSCNASANTGRREMAVSCLFAQIQGDLSRGFSFFDTQSLIAFRKVRLISSSSQLYNVVIQQHVRRLLQNPETRKKIEANLLRVGSNLPLECCIKGWDKLLKFLVDINFPVDDNCNLLEVAVDHEHCNVVQLLIKNGTDLVQALKNSIGSNFFPKTLKCFQSLGFDINMEIGQRGNERLTILNEVIDQEDVRAANMLIDSGADINPGPGIFSPLRQAAMQGLTHFVHQLIARGATDQVDTENTTVLEHTIHDWDVTGHPPWTYEKYDVYVRKNYFRKFKVDVNLIVAAVMVNY